MKKVDSEEAGERPDGEYFGLKVKICNGKVIHVIASVKGFFAVGKQLSHCHSIVDLLQNVSNAFSKVTYNTLLYGIALVQIHLNVLQIMRATKLSYIVLGIDAGL